MPERDAKQKNLPAKQQHFVDAYVGEARGNAAKAARLAGYSEATARQQGQRLLTNVDIQAAISERVSEYAMSPAEVLAEYADIARNASIVPLIELALRNQNGKMVSRPYIELLGDDGQLKPEARFVKSVKFTTNAKTEEDTVAIELHDKIAALDRLAKYHGLVVDRTALTDPSGQKEFGADSDNRRTERLAQIIDSVRARRDQSANDGGAAVVPPGGATDTSLPE